MTHLVTSWFVLRRCVAMCVLLLSFGVGVHAAVNPDPCPQPSGCSDWTQDASASFTLSLSSSPPKVCPTDSTATWVASESMSGGRRSYKVSGRSECDKTVSYGIKDKSITWTITGPITTQTGTTATATLDNSNPQPGEYTVTWTGTATEDDTCYSASLNPSFSYPFTISAPSGTAAAQPATQTVCVYDEDLSKSLSFTYTNSDTQCEHKMRWKISGGGSGVVLDGSNEGEGTSASVGVTITENATAGERSFHCDFISQVTGAVIASATAKITVQRPQMVRTEPQLTIQQDPAGQVIEACMAFTGDLKVAAFPVDGVDQLRCANGEVVAEDAWTLDSLQYFWNGAATGNAPTAHVVLTGPGTSTARCIVIARFVNGQGVVRAKVKQARWTIRVYDPRLLLRPKIVWKDQPTLDPNPAAPGDLVVWTATAQSIEGKKQCRPNPVAPIAVTPAGVRVELPPDLDPLDPDLWFENGGIRVGANAKGSYAIKFIAEAHIVDAGDVALCGGDVAPIERTVTLTVPAPKGRLWLTDVFASPNSTVSMPWVLTNTGTVTDSYEFEFTAAPEHVVGDSTNLGFEILGWSYSIVGVPGSEHDGLGATGSVSLNRGQTARGSVSIRVWNGHWAQSGTLNATVRARRVQVDAKTGKVTLPTPKITLKETQVAAGGLDTDPHTTEVKLTWVESTTFTGNMTIALIGGAGADNSTIWWWGSAATPARLLFPQNSLTEIIKSGETKAVQVNGTLRGRIVSSNKIEHANVRLTDGNDMNVQFVGGDYKIEFEKDGEGNEMKVMLPNVWRKVFVTKSLAGQRISSHTVRLVVESVTLEDGSVVSAKLGDDSGSSIPLTAYVWVDQRALVNHAYQQVLLDKSATGVQCEVMIVNPLVKSFSFAAYDFNVER